MDDEVRKAAKALSARGASKGGRTRAERLSPEDRSAIASAAAHARWTNRAGVVKATHAGELAIGDLLIPCAVLEGGQRVLSQRGLARAFGSGRTGAGAAKAAREGAPKVPYFLASEAVFPFVSSDLLMKMNSPILYHAGRGGGTAHGFDAALLPEICDVWLRARVARTLRRRSHLRTAERAELIVRGLAHVGIIALVDEATGYQADRPKDALQRILEMFIAKDLLPWTKMFPDEFFQEIFRLRGWKWVEGSTRTPRFVGRIINGYIYGRLPTGVLDELRRLNPPTNGRRRHKHHQHLTLDVGHPALSQHIRDTWTIMRTADSWSEFHRHFLKVFPKAGDPLELALREHGQA